MDEETNVIEFKLQELSTESDQISFESPQPTKEKDELCISKIDSET